MNGYFRALIIAVMCGMLIFSLGGCTPAESKENPPAQVGENDELEQNDNENNNNELKQYDGVKARIINENYPVEIETYLEDNKNQETQQAFNINNRTYLVLTMGEKPSAGYAVELKDLVLKDGYLKVFARYIKPGKDEIVATVITYPYLVIETDDIYEGHYEIEYELQK